MSWSKLNYYNKHISWLKMGHTSTRVCIIDSCCCWAPSVHHTIAQLMVRPATKRLRTVASECMDVEGVSDGFTRGMQMFWTSLRDSERKPQFKTRAPNEHIIDKVRTKLWRKNTQIRTNTIGLRFKRCVVVKKRDKYCEHKQGATDNVI